MSCHDIQVLISAYVDGELSDEEYSLISKHLDKCSECKEFYNDLKAISGMFLDVSEIEPPKSLRSNVMKQITKEAKKEEKTTNVVRLSWNFRRVAAGIVLFFLSLGIGIYPLIAHNLALSSPLELLRNQSSYDSTDGVETRSSSEPEARINVVVPSQEANEDEEELPQTDSIGVMSIEEDAPADDSSDSSNDSSEEEPTMGIMQIEVASEEEIRESKETTKDENFTKLTEVASLDEEKSFIDIVGAPKMILSFAGVFFGVLMIWYAKEQK